MKTSEEKTFPRGAAGFVCYELQYINGPKTYGRKNKMQTTLFTHLDASEKIRIDITRHNVPM